MIYDEYGEMTLDELQDLLDIPIPRGVSVVIGETGENRFYPLIKKLCKCRSSVARCPIHRGLLNG